MQCWHSIQLVASRFQLPLSCDRRADISGVTRNWLAEAQPHGRSWIHDVLHKWTNSSIVARDSLKEGSGTETVAFDDVNLFVPVNEILSIDDAI